MKRLRRSHGFTLIELLIVIGIATAISVASLTYMSRSAQDNEVQQLVTTVRSIADRARATYANEPTLYQALSMDGLLNAGAFERNMLLNPFFLSGPANSRLRVLPADRNGITRGAFQVALFAAPRHLCYGLVSRVTPDQFNEVAVNGTVIGNTNTNDGVTAAEASTACLATATNTVTLTGS